jgi:hypothetical protein
LLHGKIAFHGVLLVGTADVFAGARFILFFGPSQHDHPIATVIPRRVFKYETRARLNSEG